MDRIGIIFRLESGSEPCTNCVGIVGIKYVPDGITTSTSLGLGGESHNIQCVGDVHMQLRGPLTTRIIGGCIRIVHFRTCVNIVSTDHGHTNKTDAYQGQAQQRQSESMQRGWRSRPVGRSLA
jgi:hypothetical protein